MREPVSPNSSNLSPLLLAGILVGSIYLFNELAQQTMPRPSKSEDRAPPAYDALVIDELRVLRSPPATAIAHAISEAGRARTVVPSGLVFSAALFRSHRRAALFLAGSVAGEWALARGAKYLLRRPRPTQVRAPGQTPSFPSGHAGISSALCLALVVVARREFPRYQNLVAAIALPFAALVGLARQYLNQHFPSDVLAAHGLAAAWVIGLALPYSRGSVQISGAARQGKAL